MQQIGCLDIFPLLWLLSVLGEPVKNMEMLIVFSHLRLIWLESNKLHNAISATCCYECVNTGRFSSGTSVTLCGALHFWFEKKLLHWHVSTADKKLPGPLHHRFPVGFRGKSPQSIQMYFINNLHTVKYFFHFLPSKVISYCSDLRFSLHPSHIKNSKHHCECNLVAFLNLAACVF